jgi:O-antigen/teichoic acid export membrane protein
VSIARSVFAGAAQLTVANGLARALGILTLPLLTHWLTPEAYGQAALAGTLISLMSVLALMGMDMSYARSFLSKTAPNGKAAEAYSWRFAVVASIIAATVAAAVWLCFARIVTDSKAVLAIWIAVGTGASLLLAMAQTRSRLHGQYRRLAIAIALGGVMAAVVSLGLAWGVVKNEMALVSGYVAAYLVPLGILGVPEWRTLASRSGLSAPNRRAVFVVGLPGVITAPMYWVISSSDRWFLGVYGSTTELGIYAVACSLGTVGLMINSALIAIWLPEATRLHESDTERTEQDLGRLMAQLVLVMALIWFGIVAVGGEVLRLLTDPRFHSASIYLPWIAGGVFFYGCYHLAKTGLFLSRSLKWSAVFAAAVGAFSLLANIIFIPEYGANAAAIVRCLSFALLASVVFWVAQSKHNIPLPMGRLAVAMLPLVAVGWCMYTRWDNSEIVSLLLKLPALAAGVLVSVWLLEPGALVLAREKVVNKFRAREARGTDK